ncbi:hypothetical protein F2P81_019385 [Scophthalmus maximus]|uniref:Uncharacterized protein n=1 Tax=Scophthalmus maximus TaxID=52904 RepID=A0A6A4S7U2_SCOMX|nr:hypothetical protein F2P81_019385 [Scophthalmus maximus]
MISARLIRLRKKQQHVNASCQKSFTNKKSGQMLEMTERCGSVVTRLRRTSGPSCSTLRPTWCLRAVLFSTTGAQICTDRPSGGPQGEPPVLKDPPSEMI